MRLPLFSTSLPLLKSAAIVALFVALAARADAGDSFTLRAGTVYTMTDGDAWVLSPGVIVVRDGKIAQIGENIDPPADLPLIDLPDASVTPGLIAASTGLAGAHLGDESISAKYRAIDAYLAYEDYGPILASGVTSVHLSPGSHRLVTGVGAVVRLGGDLENRVLREATDLSINFVDGANAPPDDVTYSAPSSADVAIPAPRRQRPGSRMGWPLAIDEALAHSEPPQFADENYAALNRVWKSSLPVRLRAERAEDIARAAHFLADRDRKGYLVGGAEAGRAADVLRGKKLPLVYEAGSLRGEDPDLGYDDDPIERDLAALSRLDGVTLAISTSPGDSPSELRAAASRALAAGLSRRTVLSAITSTPARLLGVADRVGSIAPGRDADLSVFWGDPLDPHVGVYRVFTGGAAAFEAPTSDALVVRAGTVWIGPGERIEGGEVLIENGKIADVGYAVAHPPFAKVIDAGANAFVTPGFIDALGHLGLRGDRSTITTDLSLADLAGVPDLPEYRVARAGITTVMTAPYAPATSGSQVSAIRTMGTGQDDRVLSRTCGVFFSFERDDPADIGKRISSRLEAGQKYLEEWQKYEKELAEWREKKAKGIKIEEDGAKEETEKVAEGPDPITGTWEAEISGGPLPEPQPLTLRLRLTGIEVEGRVRSPGAPGEERVSGTFEGGHLSLTLDVDTGGMGQPQIEADLVAEDRLEGKVAFQTFEFDFAADRTDKAPVEFKVIKRKKRGKGGRPLPPKVDESLEPFRKMLLKELPLVVRVQTAAQIHAVLEAASSFEVKLVLVDADEAHVHKDRLLEMNAGVVASRQIVRWKNDERYHQTADLSRAGVPIAMQSDAGDGARALPALTAHAVNRGLGADHAIAAMTSYAAQMYGLGGEVGEIVPGASGDLLIFSGEPFRSGSRLERVIVGGKEVR